MSMISAQINELRKWADQLSERENEFGVVVRALVAVLRDAADTIWQLRDDLQRTNAENAKLREQTELLVTLLRNDCDIEASWDGLRKFWYIGLTESGCLMRDRVCKAEAENAKLRELVRDVHALGWSGFDCTECPRSFCERCHEDGGCPWVFILTDRMRELGVEV